MGNELTSVSLRLLGRIDRRRLVLRLGWLLLPLHRTDRQLAYPGKHSAYLIRQSHERS